MNEKKQMKNMKPTRHALFMRGVIAPIFGLVAVACVILGILNATIWKPSSSVLAQANLSGNQYIITDPGVASLVDVNTQITVQASHNKEICVASTSQKDAMGWIGKSAYTRITGLSDWNHLSTQNEGAKSAAQNTKGVEFADSDMWKDVKCSASQSTMELKNIDEDTIILIDATSAKSVQISMSWTRQSVPDFSMIFYFVAVLCVVMAVLSASVFAMSQDKRRKRVVQSRSLSTKENWKYGAQSSSKHKRHAHKASASQASQKKPIVVDPTARNLVADQQGIPAESVGEETTVIQLDELQAYFARLSQEMDTAPDATSTQVVNTEHTEQEQTMESEHADSQHKEEKPAEPKAVTLAPMQSEDFDTPSYQKGEEQKAKIQSEQEQQKRNKKSSHAHKNQAKQQPQKQQKKSNASKKKTKNAKSKSQKKSQQKNK